MLEIVANPRFCATSKGTEATWLQHDAAKQEGRLNTARSSDTEKKLKNLNFKKYEISQFLNSGNSLEILKEHLSVPEPAHKFETLALD